MGDTVKEVGAILEEVTGATDVPSSVFTLIGWFESLLHSISASANPRTAAADTAHLLSNNKDALATAVVANTQSAGT